MNQAYHKLGTIKNTRQIKYKNDTNDLMEEVARRLGVTPRHIQKEFQLYWMDVGTVFTQMLGYGFNMENFCHFLLYVQGVDAYVVKLEKTMIKLHQILDKYHVNVSPSPPERIHPRIRDVCYRLNDMVSQLVLLRSSINAYRDEVLSTYPKKYKPRRVLFDSVIKRFERFYHIPVDEFPVQIAYPIQEVFVQKLQKKGLLPNPVVHKDNEMQPMRMHYLSKDSMSDVQLPFKFLEQPY